MLLVETKGGFQLVDQNSGVLIRHEGYTCAPRTIFLAERVAMNQVQIIAELGEGANDPDWLNCVEQSGGDLELAAAAFATEYPYIDPAKAERDAAKAAAEKAAADKKAAEDAEAARVAAEKKAADEKKAAEKKAADEKAAAAVAAAKKAAEEKKAAEQAKA